MAGQSFDPLPPPPNSAIDMAGIEKRRETTNLRVATRKRLLALRGHPYRRLYDASIVNSNVGDKKRMLLMTMTGARAGFSLRPPGPSMRGWGLWFAAKALRQVVSVRSRTKAWERHTCCAPRIRRPGCLQTWLPYWICVGEWNGCMRNETDTV